MTDRFDEILDECISRIVLQGESVEECLRLYPDLAAELEPGLRVVAVAHDSYAPRPDAKVRAREALFAAMAPAADVVETPVAARTNGHHRSWLPWGNGHRSGLDQVLDECVTRIILQGEGVQDCLDRYPAYAAELAPHLWVVDRFQQAYTFTPRVESKVRARATLHQAIRDVELAPSPAWGGALAWFTPTSMRWAGSLAAVVLAAVVTAGGTAYAPQDAIPGDALYSVKTAVEGLRVTLAPTEEAKAAVLVQLTERRVEEIQKAAEQGRPESVAIAAERLDQQATRASENLDQAAAKGKDVAPLDAALARRLEQAKEVAVAAAVDAPPEVKRELIKAVDAAEKKKQDRSNRPPRPQNQNRGGNGNQGAGGSDGNRGGQQGAAGAVIPPTSTPRPQERQEPQRTAPTARPEEPRNDRPAVRPTEERRDERDERETSPQPAQAQTRVIEGVVRSVSTGQITVNNQTIVVPSGVRIEGGSIAVGVPVRVEGTLQPDGRVLATSIRITRRERRDDDEDDQDERRSPPPAAGRDENARSAERQEQERLERQRAQEQRERLDRERAAQRGRERLEREREEERLEREREKEEHEERERIERQREREREERRVRAEREERQREERQRAEQVRREKERVERQHDEQARREKERQERQRAEQERERQREREQERPTVTPSPAKTPTPRPTAVANRDKGKDQNQDKEKDRRSDDKKDERSNNGDKR